MKLWMELHNKSNTRRLKWMNRLHRGKVSWSDGRLKEGEWRESEKRGKRLERRRRGERGMGREISRWGRRRVGSLFVMRFEVSGPFVAS